MCRMVSFRGNCTICGEPFTWDELAQELPCLEAKNNGIFGDCRRGVHVDEHPFDQECGPCADAQLVDEGFGEIDEGSGGRGGGGGSGQDGEMDVKGKGKAREVGAQGRDKGKAVAGGGGAKRQRKE